MEPLHPQQIFYEIWRTQDLMSFENQIVVAAPNRHLAPIPDSESPVCRPFGFAYDVIYIPKIEGDGTQIPYSLLTKVDHVALDRVINAKTLKNSKPFFIRKASEDELIRIKEVIESNTGFFPNAHGETNVILSQHTPNF